MCIAPVSHSYHLPKRLGLLHHLPKLPDLLCPWGGLTKSGGAECCRLPALLGQHMAHKPPSRQRTFASTRNAACSRMCCSGHGTRSRACTRILSSPKRAPSTVLGGRTAQVNRCCSPGRGGGDGRGPKACPRCHPTHTEGWSCLRRTCWPVPHGRKQGLTWCRVSTPRAWQAARHTCGKGACKETARSRRLLAPELRSTTPLCLRHHRSA
mmetsp:Transcript_19932/g.54849  ORF Transcript_19932/g.54849 Transcript_19932/m.54849 type:complete len:210 (+) Transcript_19932:73-702(+)